MRRALVLIILLFLLHPSFVFAETTVCGETESDLGSGAAKGPSGYLEVTVPVGASAEETKTVAEERLKQEIKFSNYSSLLTASLGGTYESALEKLRPPAEETVTLNPQESKAQVYVTACVGGTTNWFPPVKQDITAINNASLSLAARATTPLKRFLAALPPNPAREQEIVAGQQTALNSLSAPTSPDLPGLSLHTRVKNNEGDPGESQVYWDLCVTHSPTGCLFSNFVTEVTLGSNLRVVAPSDLWGRIGNGTCISTEQLPGVAPFTITAGDATAITARLFGESQSTQANVKCEPTAAEITTDGRAGPVQCPGPYTPPGHIFQQQQTCISGSCIFNPLIIASDIASSLWQKLLNATTTNPIIQETVPIYTYYYLSGGNYGLNLGNTVKSGGEPGFNNLFRPPQLKYSEQQAQEEAKQESETTFLQHAVGPVKTTYTQIQCDFLTPPGQEQFCDKSEIQ